MYTFITSACYKQNIEVSNSDYLFLYPLTCRVAVNPPDLAREDWTIIRALSEVI